MINRTNRKYSFFQGWYFKNQNDTESISLIPAFHIDEKGNRSASLQVIMSKESHQIFYSMREFNISSGRFAIRIGNNIFTEQGILINLKDEKLTISGRLFFTRLTPLKYDIMGPFRYIPLLQCRHSIHSMLHVINGILLVNGKKMNFHQGLGYIEGDRGSGFPRNYLWTQCSWRSQGDHSLMISVADVRMGGLSFPGCIGVIYYGGKEYRLATYLGVNIVKYKKGELQVRQGKYDFHLKNLENDEKCLLAPVNGKMTRTVYESVNAKVRYRFRIGEQIIFDFVGTGCFERGL